MKSYSCPVLPLLRLCCLSAVLCLSACQKKPVEVSGQVFIMNPDGGSSKMGLVGIHVLSDGEFKALAASVVKHLLETDRWVARREANNRVLNTVENLCKWSPSRDYDTPGLDGLLDEVRARRLALGAPGGHPTYDDLLDLVMADLPAAVTRTDADGRFSISVDHKVWVIAVAPPEFGVRSEGRLWVLPFQAGETGRANPLFLSNEALVTCIRSFARIAGMDWQVIDGDKTSPSPGLVTWAVSVSARADHLAPDARSSHTLTKIGDPDSR